MESKYLQELQQYHFDRKQFADVFYDVFEDRLVDVEMMCINHKQFDDFLLYYSFNFEEFYIIHLPSGTIINWYKHLGRANTCNKEGFGLDDLKEMLQDLKLDIDGEEKLHLACFGEN